MLCYVYILLSGRFKHESPSYVYAIKGYSAHPVTCIMFRMGLIRLRVCMKCMILDQYV